ncbi:MAG: DUF3786 domain-containing protein [Anaerolineae bacterium]|nr:DUF3786 domain-containing protein [Anaerolineae bacterium]
MFNRDHLIDDAARRSAEIMIQKAEALRAELRSQAPAAVALRSGAALTQDESGRDQLALAYLGADYTVACPDFQVYRTGTGEPAYPFLQAVLLTYLQTADGAARAHRWVSFRELPGGQFYHRAFQGYTGDLLARELGDNLEAFRRGASPLAETRLGGYGDAAYAFRVLPRVYLAAVYWLGDADEGFAPRAHILFDPAAIHYMSIDGLAVIGSQLTSRIRRGAKP